MRFLAPFFYYINSKSFYRFLTGLRMQTIYRIGDNLNGYTTFMLYVFISLIDHLKLMFTILERYELQVVVHSSNSRIINAKASISQARL